MAVLNVKFKDGTVGKVDTETATAKTIRYIQQNAVPFKVLFRDGTEATLDPKTYTMRTNRYLTRNSIDGSPLFKHPVDAVREWSHEALRPRENHAGKSLLGGAIKEGGKILGGAAAMLMTAQLGQGYMPLANEEHDFPEQLVKGMYKATSEPFTSAGQNLINSAGGENIYSGVGSLIPDAVLIGKVGKLTTAAIPALEAGAFTDVAYEAGKRGGKYLVPVVKELSKAAVKEGITGTAFTTLKTGDPIEGAKAFPAWAAFGGLTHGMNLGVGFWRNPSVVAFTDNLVKEIPTLSKSEIVNTVGLINGFAKANKMTFDEYLNNMGKSGSKGLDLLKERVKFAKSTPANELINNMNTPDVLSNSTNVQDVVSNLAKQWTEYVPQKVLNRLGKQYDAGELKLSASSTEAKPFTDEVKILKQELTDSGKIKNVSEVKPVLNSDGFAQAFIDYIGTGAYPNAEMKPIFNNFRNWMKGYYEATDEQVEMSPEVRTWFNGLFREKPVTITNSYLKSTVGNSDSWFGNFYHRAISTWDTLAKYDPEFKSMYKALAGSQRKAFIEMREAVKPAIDVLANIPNKLEVTMKNLESGEMEPHTVDPFTLMSDYLKLKRIAYLKATRPDVRVPDKIDGMPLQDWAVYINDTWQTLKQSHPEAWDSINTAANMLISVPKEVFKNALEGDDSAVLAVKDSAVDNLLYKWYETGALDKETLVRIKERNDVYMPINRVISEEELEDMGKRFGTATIKRLFGSEKEIDNVVLNLMRNYMHMVPFIDKNFTKSQIINQIRETNPNLIYKVRTTTEAIPQLAKKVKQLFNNLGYKDEDIYADEVLRDAVSEAYRIFRQPKDIEPNQLSVLENGKWNVYQVNDPLLLDVLKDQRWVPTSDLGKMIDRVGLQMKSIKRTGITMMPAFIERNFIRDFGTSIVLDDTMFSGFLNNAIHTYPQAVQKMFVAYPKAFVGILAERNPSFKAFVEKRFPQFTDNLEAAERFYSELGKKGALDSEMVKEILSREGLKKQLNRWYGRGKIALVPDEAKTKFGKVADKAQSFFAGLENVSAIVEKIPRYAAADTMFTNELKRMGFDDAKKAPEAAIEQAMKNAAEKYRDITVDFSEMGSVSRIIGRYIPFLTAGISGTRQSVLSVMKDPAGFAGKSFALVTVPAVSCWLTNKDKNWYKNLSSFDKITTLPVTEHFRVPLPYEVGVIASGVPIAVMDSYYQSLVDDGLPKEEAHKHIMEDLLQGWKVIFPFADVPLPPALSLAIGELGNINPFFGNKIESPYAQGKPVFARYSSGTPETYKWISKQLYNTGNIMEKIPVVGQSELNPKRMDMLSPNMLQYALNELFGQSVNTAVKLSENAVYAAPVINKYYSKPYRSPLLANPMTSGLYKEDPTLTSYARELVDFYDNLQTMKMAVAEVKEFEKQKRASDSDREAYHNIRGKRRWALRVEPEMRSYEKRITRLLDNYREISDVRNTKYTPKEKQERQKEIMERVLNVADRGNSYYYRKREFYRNQ